MEVYTVHIVWGEVAASLYRNGVINNTVKMAHAAYNFHSKNEAGAFLYGVNESRKHHEWVQVTRIQDQRSLGMPLRSRLINAIMTGDLKEVEKILDMGVNPDTRGPNGMTALQLAAQEGQPQIAQKLLDKGAALEEAPDSPYQHSAIHLAAASHKNEAVKTLNIIAEHSKNLDATNIQGHSPLGLALAYGQLASATALILHGAKIDIPDDHGDSPHEIFEKKYSSVIGDNSIDELRSAVNEQIEQNNKSLNIRKNLVQPNSPFASGPRE